MLKSDLFQTLLDNLSDAVYFVDRHRRIQYWNRAAEELTGYRAEEVIGRCCADSVLRHVNHEGTLLCQSACPLMKAIETSENQASEVFLHHKQGHRVHVAVRVAPVRDEKDNIIGAVEVFHDNTARMEALEQLEKLKAAALLCPLTGIGNRRYGERLLHSRLAEAERYHEPFAVLFVDVDFFKQINDQYGHVAGDRALAVVARTLSACVRESDTVVRWGGEEFVCILAHAHIQDLAGIAERCRALVAESTLEVDGESVPISVSIGGTLSRTGDTEESIVDRADRLMYRSKQDGRNRCTLEESVPEPSRS